MLDKKKTAALNANKPPPTPNRWLIIDKFSGTQHPIHLPPPTHPAPTSHQLPTHTAGCWPIIYRMLTGCDSAIEFPRLIRHYPPPLSPLTSLLPSHCIFRIPAGSFQPTGDIATPPPPSPSPPPLTYLIHQLISFFPSSLSCPSFMFLSPAWLLRFVTLSTHFVNEALIESFDIGLKRCQIFTGWIDIFFFFSSFWVVVEMMAVIFIENDRFDHCLAVNESIHYFVSSSVLQMPSFSTRDVFLLN